jgi:uncharacterized RDD family membrane protein YckC/Tfp pilus assembly protein PilF
MSDEIPLPGKPARLGPRILAGLIDGAVMTALSFALYFIPLSLGSIALPLLGALVAIIGWSVVPCAAFRATLGMRVTGIEIVGMDGRPADFTELLARDLLGRGLIGFAYFSTVIVAYIGRLTHVLAFFQPTGIGLVLFFTSGALIVLAFCGQMPMLAREDRRGLPDLMAKTIVIARGSLRKPEEAPDDEERAAARKAHLRRVRNVAVFEIATFVGAIALPYALSRPFNPGADFAARAKIASAEQAFAHNPASQSAAGDLIYLLNETGDQKRAAEILERHHQALSAQSSEQEKELRAALQRDPKDWDAFGTLLEILDRSERTAEAKESFERFVAADPTPDNRASYGVWLYRHKMATPAAQELKKAIADGDGGAETRAYLGWALLELGQKKEAREAFLDALEIDPELDEVQADLGKLDEAESDK